MFRRVFKYFVLLLLVSLGKVALCQNLLKDIVAINVNYSRDSSFKIDMKVSVKEAESVLESQSYKYIQDKGKILSTINGTSTLISGDVVLIIDKRSKNIVLSSPKSLNNYSISSSYDSLVKQAKSHEFGTADSGVINYYTLYYGDNIYDKVKIFFQPATHLLKRVEIHYSNNVEGQLSELGGKYLSFEYSVPTKLNKNDKLDLVASNYIEKNGSKIKLSKKYINYNLIDYRPYYQE